MCMLTHRLQLLLDDERYQRVQTLARQRGTSVAAVIREALDRGLPATQRRRSAAARRILAAEPMQAPSPFLIITEHHGQRSLLRFEGELDVCSTDYLRQAIGDALEH